ncbi:uncharacterized protein LOC116114071 [Pistacia vera]|uniref:uncharacterized protein LOC116114071 n=1 Tax=Pistacia vera TaxID=55513 RepID=UPI0012636F49|nr:uncharacterized protein LOC116114071 [Pistacia vera]
MTSASQLFDSYIPCSGNQKVKIADGSLSPIAGKGSIKLSNTIELKSFLHVPRLSCNLLSVSKLSKDSNCLVTFFDSHCEFQDWNLGTMIGSAKMVDGLYYFNDNLTKNKQAFSLSNPILDLSLTREQRAVYSWGESKSENHFWQTSIALPNTIFPEVSSEAVNPMNTSNFENSDQGIVSSQTEVEPPLLEQLVELRVYSRKRYHSNNRVHATSMALDQSLPSNSTPEETPDLYLPIALRKGVRECTKHPIAKYLSYHRLSSQHKAFVSNLSKQFVPRTIKEALEHPDWKLAVFEEMNALLKNKTWEVSELPSGKKAVGCEWLDIKNAFLNGDLEEEVFMDLPPGFEEKLGKNKVCRLKKSLYGLKQSPRAWFERFTKAVKRQGYKQGQADHTLFHKKTKEGKLAILFVYVDDIILTGDDDVELAKPKGFLANEFEIKDLGTLKYFLGMEFARSRKGISISQRKYTLELLNETGLLGCKTIKTPIERNLKPQPAKPEDVVDRERYQ